MYGVNFGHQDIPEDLKRRLKRAKRPEVWNRNARLVGVAESKTELGSMLIIANNGHRQLFVIPIPHLHEYYGIYAY